MTDAPHTGPEPSDPVADDIATRNADTDDVVAGEQVLDEGHVAPEPDELEQGETRHDRLHAADERTDPGAPPAQEEPG